MSTNSATPAPAAGASLKATSPAPPSSFDLSDPIPLENDALNQAQQVTVGALLGLPALFSGVLPRLFAVAAEANTEGLAVLFFAFCAAYFTLPLAYIALRGSGWEVWKRSGMIALLGALSITCASLFVTESTLVRLSSSVLSLAGLSFLAYLAYRRFVPRREQPFIRTVELRGIHPASATAADVASQEAATSAVSVGSASETSEILGKAATAELAPGTASAGEPADSSAPPVTGGSPPLPPAPARPVWVRVWNAAPAASFTLIGVLAAVGLCWMWAGPMGFLREIRQTFALAQMIEEAGKDNDAARLAVANAARPLNPAYLIATRDTASAAAAKQGLQTASTTSKQAQSSDALLASADTLADRTRAYLTALALQEDSAGHATVGTDIQARNQRIASLITSQDSGLRARTALLNRADTLHERSTNVLAANVALRLRQARRAWNDLATRPLVDSAGRSIGMPPSPQATGVTSAENAWDQFLADWTDDQAAYLRLRQEQQRDVQALLELKTKSAQRRLAAIYERVRVRGLVMLCIALAWLLFAYYRQFSRLPEGTKLSPLGEYRKQSYRIAFAFLIILIVPLLPTLKEAKVDPTRPIESFTMRSWYLPGFLTQEVREEFMEPGGLPSRGAAGGPSAGSGSLLPITVQVDTGAARQDTVDHRETIGKLTEEIQKTNELIGGLNSRVTTLESGLRIVGGEVRVIDEKVDTVAAQTDSIWGQVQR